MNINCNQIYTLQDDDEQKQANFTLCVYVIGASAYLSDPIYQILNFRCNFGYIYVPKKADCN